MDGDVGVRRERGRAARTAAAPLRQRVRHVETDEQAAAGDGRDLQKRAPVESRIFKVSAMTYPFLPPLAAALMASLIRM